MLRAVDLSRSELPQLRVLDATPHGCNLANVQARQASLVRLAVTGAAALGIEVLADE